MILKYGQTDPKEICDIINEAAVACKRINPGWASEN